MNPETPKITSTITRRVFIKRTTATALACSVASSLLYANVDTPVWEKKSTCKEWDNTDFACKQMNVSSLTPGKVRDACKKSQTIGVGNVCVLFKDDDCIPASGTGTTTVVTGFGWYYTP